jgi:hypothetical protein
MICLDVRISAMARRRVDVLREYDSVSVRQNLWRCKAQIRAAAKGNNMKKLLVPSAIVLLGMLLFGGCVASVGSGSKTTVNKPTLGQQLVDLQKAKESGAITEAEYQTQKTKLLETN